MAGYPKGRKDVLISVSNLQAIVAAIFMLITMVLVLASVREWISVVRGRKPAVTRESTFVESAYA